MTPAPKRGTGQIIREGDEISALGNALGDAMAEQALPGLFTGGKQIVGTRYVGGDNAQLMFVFNDGSVMRLVGSFTAEFAQGTGRSARDGNRYVDKVIDEVVEGEAWEVLDFKELTGGQGA